MRFLFYLFLIFFLCGCASRPLPAFLTPDDQQLFVQGMTDLDLQGDPPAAFASLQQSHPESPWTNQARTVSELLETTHKQQKSIDRLKRAKNFYRRENKVLHRKIDSLEADRQKLKQLLIDLERRGG
ncbi:hypothetical protein Pcar_2290 [Syntrophotalea carbinolica DSM 2380]|uniref:Lipoprotein n=1 Tax=Syntrophotalea carbinolica (strain DSM 2380 / NBRC 103641 / GraBd1) TaxID=338963 RepID=Q3A278_SYNC1|nr:hypothetical protein [Syntrophotalea carbinolica]ABA89529.3 hypothetical protein Pcar_2290 [Syntrophotalea carbinolica DSM 2380]